MPAFLPAFSEFLHQAFEQSILGQLTEHLLGQANSYMLYPLKAGAIIAVSSLSRKKLGIKKPGLPIHPPTAKVKSRDFDL
jgi:hypothetical protein